VGTTTKRTQFTVAMQEIETLIDDIKSDVRDGFFNSTQRCRIVGGNVVLSGAPNAGSNEECIFLGKVIDFGNPDSTQYKVYTVVGRRFSDLLTKAPVTSLKEARPKISSTETFNYPWSVSFKGSHRGSTNTGINQLGIFHRLDNTNISTLLPVAYYNTGAAAIGTASSYNTAGPQFGDNLTLDLCFHHPGTEKGGTLRFGGDTRNLSSELDLEYDCTTGQPDGVLPG